MDCVNHSGTTATAYCQNCGKALCAACVRNAAGGQLFCEPCSMAWQSYQQPFVAPPSSGPNPAAAAALGVIPGVGAMYNGQFLKGFIHVVIFAVLISISEYYPLFGIFIAAWVIYQSFEAFHTAKALREGQPVPDPFGLNEVGNWLNVGTRLRGPNQPNPWQPPAGPVVGDYQQPPYDGQPQPPNQASYQQPPPYQAPYQTPYQAPFTPPPPVFWGRKEPVGAIVLIALGMMFLLGQLDIFHGRFMEFAFPLILIGLGVWLVVRRINDAQGGSK